jgi:hypothetical protein
LLFGVVGVELVDGTCDPCGSLSDGNGDFEGEEDDGLGGLFKSKSLSFQIAFNTLLKNEILIEDNE